ncbi:YabP/YqfC family sporulation protein [Sedimentibacter sp. zth1]|uniref:YabP/YqfC family sporulation protein n=1 Tax=Sedimentibacter sp. zth1 TaxID=2816908 RepID=UPI001A92C1A7|nr:YabP/YqfC family sporulation protein [Sedimentibacter sp. zth1]QSX06842.1 YabP/YqfC family sporulation protein [Sedimentibacter sp. zth1]
MKINKIRSKIADELELPDHVVTDNFDIRIQGNKRVIIENHIGVLIYENDLVHIKTKIQNVIIKGDKLKIGEITDFYIVVNGAIKEIQIKE